MRQGNWRKTVKGKVQVSLNPPWDWKGASPPLYHYGDVLQIYGRLELPPAARNLGEFDYRAYLARRGIFARMGVEPQDVEVLGHRQSGGETGVRRQGVGVGVMEQALPPREAGILAAVLFGDQERPEEVEVYGVSGSIGRLLPL